MLKNYPSTYLFLLSAVVFVIIAFGAPIVGSWSIYCALVVDVLKFTMRVVLGFFLCCTIIEITQNFFFRHHH